MLRGLLKNALIAGSIFCFVSSSSVLAQKRVLDTVDYKKWKIMGSATLSEDGQMAMYNLLGSSVKRIINTNTGKEISVEGLDLETLFKKSPNPLTEKKQKLFDPLTSTPPQGYRVLPGNYYINPGSRRLLVDLAPQKVSETKDGKLNSMKSSVDLEIWVWNDRVTERRKRKGGTKRPPEKARFIYHLDTKSWTNVTPGEDEILIASENSALIFIADPKPYYYSLDWKYYNNQDIYSVDVNTGIRKLVARDSYTQPQFSPNGRYAVMYDQVSKEWKVYDPNKREFIGFSGQIKYPIYEEDYDMPRPAPAHGIAGWLNDGTSVLIYDRYDVWVIDLSAQKKPYMLTQGYGRRHGIAFRFLGADYQDYVNLDNYLMFRTFNENTKSAGVYRLSPEQKIQKLIDDPNYSVKVLDHAAGDSSFLFTKQNFQIFPDIWWANADFSVQRKLTDANPQQQEFLWGSAKVIEWKNFKGVKNQGLLYLPENYDPKKSYPVIVDFYERHSGQLHEYFTPLYSINTIDIPSYLSKGYIVFRPDTHFIIGEPSDSFYNSVVSGTEALIKKGIADKDRIGLQGHSWSGYAVTYLLTRTDIFKCANAGAAVVNMTNGYFAIRSSGAPCLFRYEVEQSRIGKSLWEDRKGYISNSPIFNADKIQTPLLILHNDKDGAVAFTQGTDFFLAMRRLQKPAWLLNYKGEGHVLSELPAQQDWTLRMGQFFDHYLKGDPMPEWMGAE